MLPGTNLTTGQWVRVADSDDPVDCNSNSASDPFRCTSLALLNATLSLYLAQSLSGAQEGWYKCCLPTNCSDPNTNIIFANIFSKCFHCASAHHCFTVGWGEIADITVDLPSKITVLPQTYTLHAIKVGDSNQNEFKAASWYYYVSDSASTEITTGLCNGQSGYSCSIGNGVLLHQSNGSYDYTLTVTWNGETITSGILSQSSNNGDHVFRFYLHLGGAMRNHYITITGNLRFFYVY